VAVLGILGLVFGGGALWAHLHRTTPSWYLGADETSISACKLDAPFFPQGLVAKVVLDNPSDHTANLGVNVEWDDPKHYPVTLGTGFASLDKVPGLASRTVTVEGNVDPEAVPQDQTIPTTDPLRCKVIGPSTIAPSQAR